MVEHREYEHAEYYRYLNAGYRLPLVGGTDKVTSSVPVGLYRTYVHVPEGEEFTYESWCRNLRLGRTFLSSGPMIGLSVEGHRPGDELGLPTCGTVEVEAWADSVLPIRSLQVVLNGRVVAFTEVESGARQLRLREKVHIEGHSWIAARCAGPGYTSISHHDWRRRGVMAHTSPIYVAVGQPWRMFDAATAEYMLTLLHGGIEYIRKQSPQYPKGSITHAHGESDHMAFLECPYREAIEAVHRLMHEYGIPH
jgi:hypothetical protein